MDSIEGIRIFERTNNILLDEDTFGTLTTTRKSTGY